MAAENPTNKRAGTIYEGPRFKAYICEPEYQITGELADEMPKRTTWGILDEIAGGYIAFTNSEDAVHSIVDALNHIDEAAEALSTE